MYVVRSTYVHVPFPHEYLHNFHKFFLYLLRLLHDNYKYNLLQICELYKT